MNDMAMRKHIVNLLRGGGAHVSFKQAIADLPAISLAAGNVFCHPQFATDKPLVRGLIEGLTETLDLAEPFGRIREAIG